MAAAPEMGNRVRARLLVPFLAGLFVCAIPARAGTYYVTVAGLGGEADYEQQFEGIASDLDKAFKNSGSDSHVYTLAKDDATRARLTQTLGQVAQEAKPDDDFVLVLIGHGSFDGVEYKFNLVGPDISGAELAALCDRIASKRQLIVNTTSASGGSIAAFQKPGRAVIAATKTGTEKNATVFARYWTEAFEDPTADLDKNNAITALEAFEYATGKTAEFYESQKRLATEHAVFEDMGKGDPVRAAADSGEGRLLSSITLVRSGPTENVGSDPARLALVAKKEELEQKIDVLKYGKAAMSEDDYRAQLKAALLELAKVQEELDK